MSLLFNTSKANRPLVETLKRCHAIVFDGDNDFLAPGWMRCGSPHASKEDRDQHYKTHHEVPAWFECKCPSDCHEAWHISRFFDSFLGLKKHFQQRHPGFKMIIGKTYSELPRNAETNREMMTLLQHPSTDSSATLDKKHTRHMSSQPLPQMGLLEPHPLRRTELVERKDPPRTDVDPNEVRTCTFVHSNGNSCDFHGTQADMEKHKTEHTLIFICKYSRQHGQDCAEDCKLDHGELGICGERFERLPDIERQLEIWHDVEHEELNFHLHVDQDRERSQEVGLHRGRGRGFEVGLVPKYSEAQVFGDNLSQVRPDLFKCPYRGTPAEVREHRQLDHEVTFVCQYSLEHNNKHKCEEVFNSLALFAIHILLAHEDQYFNTRKFEFLEYKLQGRDGGRWVPHKDHLLHSLDRVNQELQREIQRTDLYKELRNHRKAGHRPGHGGVATAIEIKGTPSDHEVSNSLHKSFYHKQAHRRACRLRSLLGSHTGDNETDFAPSECD
ncbi:hypothetical protein T439DRAFT_358916 [Meredithblackwellia eburnea MCA 4105]